MHYHYQLGALRERGKAKRRVITVFCLILVAGIFYGGLLYLSPQLVAMPLTPKSNPNATARKIEGSQPTANMLYIPQLNVEVPLAIGGEAGNLAHGAWQRSSKQSVKDGGTVTVCASAFEFGLTPWQTRVNSPFYNIGRLQKGDQIVLDYKNDRYEYKVTGQLDGIVESKSDEPGLIIFACDAAGELSGAAVGAVMVTSESTKGKDNGSALW